MQINESSQNALQQLEELIQQLSDKEYTQPQVVFSGASTGQHIRHILEFYTALKNATDSICYDNRKRDLLLETSTEACINIIQEIKHWLTSELSNKAMILQTSLGTEKITTTPIPTSFHREHLYVLEHAVHHMAILKIGISSLFPHIKLPPEFGVADSTLRYQSNSIQCAQ